MCAFLLGIAHTSTERSTCFILPWKLPSAQKWGHLHKNILLYHARNLWKTKTKSTRMPL